MEHLAERVAHLAAELEKLQLELRLTSPAAWRIDKLRNPDPRLVQLRISLDRARLFLWAYLQSVRASGDLQAELDLARAERTSDMLRELRHLLRNPAEASVAIAPLLAEIHSIVTPGKSN